MALSADSQAILLLCSHLGLPKDAEPGPLSLRDWNPLAEKIVGSPFKSPGSLLDTSVEELRSTLDISGELAGRIRSLLDRGTALAIELDRLESLGIWAMTRSDDQYPARLQERLGKSAPSVVFGSGPIELIGAPGLAIVGSRNVDEEGKAVAEFAGRQCAKANWIVYSGAARGVDEVAMQACLDNGGQVVGVLADSLEKAVRAPFSRQALFEGNLALLTPYSPKAPFSVGMAMGRNKIIYALADYALIVASDADTGGTWSGATEALRAGEVPIFVRDGDSIPEGNKKLLQRGGIAFPFPFPEESGDLLEWMNATVQGKRQGTLF